MELDVSFANWNFGLQFSNRIITMVKFGKKIDITGYYFLEIVQFLDFYMKNFVRQRIMELL